MKTNELPKTGFQGLKAHFKDDLLAGFSVSLIALPLCLGIAIASGFPPLAGLITAIVGGMIASRISGTFVTISGPAAGLIVISLGAAESMGGAGADAGFAGYPHALGAIVIAGFIMALFGLLKVGKVGDYFPVAAVHGMLAAIGIIIIIKQIFPAIGVAPPKGEILEVVAEIPAALADLNPYASLLALITLCILIVHPLLKIKLIKAIPAPMWVLLITIPVAFLVGHDNLSLVRMPHSLLGEDGIQFPSFEKIGESAFWIAVTGFALVSGIESMLSAKAVDTLDPYKRTSNLNKDLISMGTGSSVAASIGGLPMISEIVRSSANVNNGAKTQWSNFFHGSFLLVYLLIGVAVIELIPVAALAAMLVFTGFRLASPKEFRHMFKIGLMELEIFLVTLVAVLATDLIIGIAIGILFKYILVIFKGAKPGELFRSRFKVEYSGDKKVIRLSGVQIFSNYLSLKKKLDSGTKNHKELVLDFSNVLFVDHTVMEHLETYARKAEERSVKVTIDNIEGLNPVSDHPLAARDRNAKLSLKSLNIEKRTLEILSFAKQKGILFINEALNHDSWDFYSITTRKKIIGIKNVLSSGPVENGFSYTLADITTVKGAHSVEDVDSVTVLKVNGIRNLPKFYMAEESLIDRMKDVITKDDIDFEDFPEFSKNCVLKGVDENAVRVFFTADLLTYLEKNSHVFLISNGEELLLRTKYRLLRMDEIAELLKIKSELLELIQNKG